MSLFAGIYSRDGSPLDEGTISAFRRVIGRAGDVPATYRDARFFVAKVNVGALDSLALHTDSSGGVTALAGSLLCDDGVTSRSKELDRISPVLSTGALDILKRCRGQFCLAQYRPRDHKILLATDFVGIRPLYYHSSRRFLIFATALHILGALEIIPKQMDTRGVTESISFGYPLGNRTSYADIKVLRSGEALTCTENRLHLRTYASLSDIVESPGNYRTLVRKAYELFICAIRRRSSASEEATAFLSGGLDSRCIVAGLKTLGKQVTCINIRRPGRLDTVLAERFARAINVRLITQDVPKLEAQWKSKGRALNRLELSVSKRTENRRVVFSGDGGSVGVGHEYVDRRVVEFMRRRDIEEVCRYVIEERGRPSRLAFSASRYKKIVQGSKIAIRTELKQINEHIEPGRRYHLFVMRTDQFRHLHHHYNHIDEYRCELMTPFFDSEFLSFVMSLPIDACLLHRFYYDWMEHFPEVVRRIPWQAYRGHLPCPIPLAEEDECATNQWQRDRKEEWLRARRPFRDCLRRFLSQRLPPSLGIPRWRTLLVLLLHAMRIRNGMGMFKTFNAYHEAVISSGGQMTHLEERQGADAASTSTTTGLP